MILIERSLKIRLRGASPQLCPLALYWHRPEVCSVAALGADRHISKHQSLPIGGEIARNLQTIAVGEQSRFA